MPVRLRYFEMMLTSPDRHFNPMTPQLLEKTMNYRTEKDFLGEKQLPETAYYGVQTLRGKENFHIEVAPVSRTP